MFNSLMLGVALTMGQTPAQAPRPYYQNTSFHSYQQAVQGQPLQAQPAHGSCFNGHGCEPCRVEWLKRWKCEDLEMKPVERKCRTCGFFHSLLWCPEEEEEAKNGNGEAKNGNGEKKNGEAKNGEQKNGADEKKEEEAEEEPDRKPLMQFLYCRTPGLFDFLDCRGINIYGFVQGGFTTDFRTNTNNFIFGANYNHNDTSPMLNQAYITIEKALDHEKKKDMFHWGGRVDFYTGHDTPDLENISLGLFENFTGNRLNVNTPYPNTPPPFASAFPCPWEFGISMPQFYLDAHLPVLTDRGVDLRVGRFYTLMGAELNDATRTDFYSHSYEFYFNAYTHTGAMVNLHVADTIESYHGWVRGWDTVFTDYNDTGAYHGGLTWTACDKRKSLALTWMTGPEPTFVSINQNQLWRTTLTSYLTLKFGACEQWRLVTGGHMSWQPGASANVNAGGVQEAAEWYGYNNYLFYTVSPKLILGSRSEWYRDDDGFRTGFPTSILAQTLNFTYKPYQNLRIRPEARYDYATQASPFNAGTRRDQFVLGFDVIYDF